MSKSRDNKLEDESIDFVARHYRRGAFSRPGGPWGILPRFSLRRPAVAAATVAAILASAAIITKVAYIDNQSKTETRIEAVTPSPVVTEAEFSFSDSSLTDVIAEIEKTYNIKVTNLPSEEYHLTLSFKGNAEDLLDMINSLLGTDLKIEKSEPEK